MTARCVNGAKFRGQLGVLVSAGLLASRIPAWTAYSIRGDGRRAARRPDREVDEMSAILIETGHGPPDCAAWMQNRTPVLTHTPFPSEG
jgi:hypothetical protein